MAQTFFREAVRDLGPDSDCEVEITVEIAVHNWGCDAQTYGPAESCFPAEGMEVEIVDCWRTADSDKDTAPRITLTDAERQRIESDFMENPPEDDYGDDGE